MAVCEKYHKRAYCWFDGSTWEWENFNEPDGSADHSELTSVSTDFKHATSASDDVSDFSKEDLIAYFKNSGYAACRFPNGPYCHYAATIETAKHGHEHEQAVEYRAETS